MSNLSIATEATAVSYTVFGPPPREHGFTPLRVEGRVPEGLRGTLYRNGPADFSAGRRPHWFDGNGAITAVRFTDDGVTGAVRQTHAPSADHDAGRHRNRYGAFRQAMSWPQRVRTLFGQPGIRNAANINVLPWQGRLFALYETCLPLEVDPETLETIGETDLDGIIPAAWNAHPHRVPARRATYQLGLRIGPRVHMDVFALPDIGPARLLASVPLPGVTELHDFFATEHHLIVVLPPLYASPLNVVRRGSFVEALQWQPDEGTEILVIPIDAPEKMRRIRTEPFFYWHSANAYESGDGKSITLDLVRYPDFPAVLSWIDNASAGKPGRPPNAGLWRGEIDLVRGRARWEERWPQSCEFPMVNPARLARPQRHTWLAAHSGNEAASGWWNRIARVTTDSGTAVTFDPGPNRAVGEPVPVRKSDQEDDVWLLVMVRDTAADATHLAIWDAARPDEDAIARIWFDQQLPPSLHGAWVAA